MTHAPTNCAVLRLSALSACLPDHFGLQTHGVSSRSRSLRNPSAPSTPSSYTQLHNGEIVRHLYSYGPDASGEATLKPVTGGEWQVEEVVAVDEEMLGIQLGRLQIGSFSWSQVVHTMSLLF